ncbi:eukaryotic translation initiation factor 2c [Arthroderma uncinatum]|uniref:eukaryotic translation initiation factor 2c n=1 Tax=Arthroderma uncinatum TaxID=74035 RepID=UPI00144A8073|nr:eukaryotic translation initiation factor 2c [Arthroderma uncinatum]KAF3491565.1 eukaryotic translation initiation factor 2c [Arthroderma uncinatum]
MGFTPFEKVPNVALRNLNFNDEPADQYYEPVPLVQRPGYNTTGKDISLSTNFYPILDYPKGNVHQYDVMIGNGDEKRVVIQKVWDSNARKSKLGRDFIFDGSKLAWSLTKLKHDLNIVVDLDAEQGRTGSKTSNAFRLVVRYTKTIGLAALAAAIRGNHNTDKEAGQCLTFFNHLLRETPSQKFIAIKSSYFSENSIRTSVGCGVDAFKGIFQAIRVVQPGSLAINVDVSNACFWSRNSLLVVALSVFEVRDAQQLIFNCKPERDGLGGYKASKKFQLLERMRKLSVKADYPGCPCLDKEWTIKGFLLANSKEYKLEIKDRATGKINMISVFDYFKNRYNYHLTYWELPLVQMTKKDVVYPMEVLVIHRAQKYPFKLNDLQTSSMIKFAVTRPAERRKAIEESKKNLQHPADPVLKAYGVVIGDKMIKTRARLLPNPEILFGGNQKLNPQTNGRWDLRGKKFYSKNTKPLKSWGVAVFKGRHPINKAQVEAFCDALVRAYQGHGGDIESRRPEIIEVGPDPAKGVFDLFHATGNRFNLRPELMIFVVADRQSFHYSRIKKSCDCRFGVPSQVLQGQQVVKCNGQYISNVLMKINAKLGGTTARVTSKTSSGLPPYTMIIGADVSHSSPGSFSPSMAAMTVSMDTFGGRYTAGCETNGERVEIISQANVKSILSPLIREWVMNTGKGSVPKQVYYFRDGLSSGQFQACLREEIPHIKKIFTEIMGSEWPGKMTIVVASKRHHVRAFPEPTDRMASDKNGNPLPGTLIERDVTDPYRWDFLLYSHIALQGTSRPVHYHVLIDEMKHNPNQLQNMIYDHCYQYMRSTTSVSLFPAVYYAHLASARARSHEDVPASSGPQSGPGIKQGQAPPPGPRDTEIPQLLPMPNNDRIGFKMWYI